MIDITKDIHSVTTFRRNPGLFMKQLKKNKRPVAQIDAAESTVAARWFNGLEEEVS